MSHKFDDFHEDFMISHSMQNLYKSVKGVIIYFWGVYVLKKEVIFLVVAFLVLASTPVVRADSDVLSYDALLAMVSLALVIFVGVIFFAHKFRKPGM